MRTVCYFCHIKTIEKLLQKFNPSEEVANEFVFRIHDLISEMRELSNPLIATHVHRIAKKYLNHDDLYFEEKKAANDLILGKYEFLKERVMNSKNPFRTAARLAVAGNIIDYAAHSMEEDLEAQIDRLIMQDLAVDETERMEKAVNEASSILYLGDNAGEGVFDKLFIETMNHPNLTFVVRGQAVINDNTMEDARYIGMDKVCKVIHNGFDAPSTLLNHCSSEFVDAFQKAGMIISKGQGNYEGLIDLPHPEMYFLLMAKCNPMAEMLGVSKGDMVVKTFN